MAFFWETIILFSTTLIFYIASFSLFYYWKESKQSFIVPPLLFTFEFFVTAFFVIFAISIAVRFGPSIATVIVP